MMTLLEWLCIYLELFSIIKGARTFVGHWRLSTVDPFGRRCQDMGPVDNPDYQSRKQSHPHEHFVQVAVIMYGIDCVEKTAMLLQGPDHRNDVHLRYVFHTGIVRDTLFKQKVRDIIQPWMEQGYIPVRSEVLPGLLVLGDSLFART